MPQAILCGLEAFYRARYDSYRYVVYHCCQHDYNAQEAVQHRIAQHGQTQAQARCLVADTNRLLRDETQLT